MKYLRLALFGLLLILGTTSLSLTPAAAAPRAPLVVNSKSDSNDGNCNPSNCTLREAILAANANSGLDTINFNIAGCPCPILIGAALPDITDPVLINGYSQSGATANTQTDTNDAVLKIALAGMNAPPGTNGLVISGGGSTVKGLNIIFFPGAAIWLKTNGGNIIQGNWIGIKLSGTSDASNGRGIWLTHGTSLNVLGGTAAAEHNLISGNTNEGILLDVLGGSANRNSISGNLVGLDKDALNAVPNGIGILILSRRNWVGQGSSSAFNIIAGNSGAGIEIRGTGAIKNRVIGNAVGEISTGNGTHGIWIHAGAKKNKVGGSTPALANFITSNGAAGIAIQDDTSIRNALRVNAILFNSGLGIDLAADGVTLNDAGDVDSGPNRRQNCPILRLADSVANRIKGKLKAKPNAPYTIDLFEGSACDASGFGEGFYVQSVNVTTNASGIAKFNVITSSDFPSGLVFTATATDAKGNTSEFSRCKIAQ